MPPKKATKFPRFVVGADETYRQRGLKYDECHENYANFRKTNADALNRLQEAVIQIEKGEIEISKTCEPTTDRGERVLTMDGARRAKIWVVGDDCDQYIERFLREIPVDHLVVGTTAAPVFEDSPHIIIPSCSGFLVVKEDALVKGTCIKSNVYDSTGKIMYRHKKGDKKAVCRLIRNELGVGSRKQIYSLFEWAIKTCSPNDDPPKTDLLFDHLGLYRRADITADDVTDTAAGDVAANPDAVSVPLLPTQSRGKKYCVDALGRYIVINAANKDCPMIVSNRRWDGHFREDLIPKAGEKNPPYLTVSRTAWKKGDRRNKKCVTCGMALVSNYDPSYRIKSINFGLPNIRRPADLRAAMDINPDGYHLCYSCAHSLDDSVFKQTGIVLERFEHDGEIDSAVEHLARSDFDYLNQDGNLILYVGKHRECYVVSQSMGGVNRGGTRCLVKALSECVLDRFPYMITNVYAWTVTPTRNG